MNKVPIKAIDNWVINLTSPHHFFFDLNATHVKGELKAHINISLYESNILQG